MNTEDRLKTSVSLSQLCRNLLELESAGQSSVWTGCPTVTPANTAARHETWPDYPKLQLNWKSWEPPDFCARRGKIPNPLYPEFYRGAGSRAKPQQLLPSRAGSAKVCRLSLKDPEIHVCSNNIRAMWRHRQTLCWCRKRKLIRDLQKQKDCMQSANWCVQICETTVDTSVWV